MKQYNKKRHIFILENLGCAHCAAKMEEQINQIYGIHQASISFATKQLHVTADEPEKYLDEIKRICTSIESDIIIHDKNAVLKDTIVSNYADTDKISSCTHHEHTDHHNHAGGHKHTAHNIEIIQIISGAVLFAIGICGQYIKFPEPITLGIFIFGYLLLGGKILAESCKNILKGQIFDENFLMSIATLGAFAIHEYPEAMGIMLFYRIGELFEHNAVEKSRTQIMNAIDMRPEVVSIYTDQQITEIPVSDVQIGQLLLIRPGDRIPLDGTIVEGESRLDTSPITGEPVPVTVKSGDEIISGCINTHGQLIMRVDKPLEESMVSRILESVENAAANKPKIQRFITKFAHIYTPVVVISALFTAIIPSLISGNWNYWLYTALTFLVMSCPCALVLSVPLAFFSGIGSGSKKGILFKGGLSIEALSNIKAIVVDKTGTITKGDFKLQKIVSLGNYKEWELLQICASCEQHSNHPIAHSIVLSAQEKEMTLHAPASLLEVSGKGIAANLNEKEILCGNRSLMTQHHVNLDPLPEKINGVEVLLAIDGKIEGYFIISDTLKPDAPSAISKIKKLGLRTCMLTGDCELTAKSVAEETGIEEVFAQLLPQDKLTILQQLRKKYGSVMFVGDGINDAPVLAGADVGAAMGSGADAAIEAADTVFMNTNVESIADAITIARNTKRIAIQNVIFALTVKIIVMILGLCGFANMWLAVFADTGVAMICVLNSIRSLYRK